MYRLHAGPHVTSVAVSTYFKRTWRVLKNQPIAKAVFHLLRYIGVRHKTGRMPGLYPCVNHQRAGTAPVFVFGEGSEAV